MIKTMRRYIVEIGADILQTVVMVTPILLGLYTVALTYMGALGDGVVMAVALLGHVLKSRMLRDEVGEHRMTKQRIEWLLRHAALYDKSAETEAYIAKIEGRKPGDDPAKDVETELFKAFAQELRDLATIILTPEDDATARREAPSMTVTPHDTEQS